MRYFSFFLVVICFTTALGASDATFTLQGMPGDTGSDFIATPNDVQSEIATAAHRLSIHLMPVESTSQNVVAAGDHTHDGIYAHVDGTSSLTDIDTVTELKPQLLTLKPASVLPTCDGAHDGQLIYFAQQLHLCRASLWTALQPTCNMGNVGEVLVVTSTTRLLCDGVSWQIQS